MYPRFGKNEPGNRSSIIPVLTEAAYLCYNGKVDPGICAGFSTDVTGSALPL